MNKTVEQLEKERKEIDKKLRIAKINEPEWTIKLNRAIEDAKKKADSVSLAYQYSGPTMQEFGHGELASCIQTLLGYISDLRLLLGAQDGCR